MVNHAESRAPIFMLPIHEILTIFPHYTYGLPGPPQEMFFFLINSYFGILSIAMNQTKWIFLIDDSKTLPFVFLNFSEFEFMADLKLKFVFLTKIRSKRGEFNVYIL